MSKRRSNSKKNSGAYSKKAIYSYNGLTLLGYVEFYDPTEVKSLAMADRRIIADAMIEVWKNWGNLPDAPHLNELENT